MTNTTQIAEPTQETSAVTPAEGMVGPAQPEEVAPEPPQESTAAVETPKQQPKAKPKKSVFEKVEEELKKVLVRCPNCPWKAGLLDELTICPVCNGSGKVEAEPLD